jgi:ketosteroid isomerase-like protein
MPSDSPDISTLVRAYFKAFDDRNREALEPLLADEFRFTSPYDDAIDRAAFFAQCWPNGDNHKSHTLERILPDADTAFVTYLLTRKDNTASRNTEYFTARNGKLTRIDVYFGANYVNGEFVPEG